MSKQNWTRFGWIVGGVAAFGLVGVMSGCGAAPAPCPTPPAESPAPAPPSPATGDAEAMLVLDGTPPIPAELVERLNQYLNTRGASVLDVSADGGAMLIETRFGDTSQLHLVRQPMGARTQITFAAEPIRAATFVPGGTGEVVYRADQGGDEEYRLFRLDLGTGRATALTPTGSRVVDFVFSEDGSRLAWASNARNGTDTDVWIGSGKPGDAGSAVVTLGGYWYPLRFSPDGSQLLVGRYVSITDSSVHLVDVASGAMRSLVPEGESGAYRSAAMGADGRVYVASDLGGEFVGLHAADPTKLKYVPLTADIPWNVEALTASADGARLAFVVNEAGLGRVYLYEVATGKRTAVEGLPPGVVSGLRFAPNAPTLVLTLNSATTTADAYSVSLADGAVTRWTQSEVGGLDPSRFVEPKLIEFPSFDGLKITGFYFQPPGEGPFPVVVNIHGGPEAQARPYFSAATQYMLLEQGFAVIFPNVRGSDGYGRTFLTLDNGMKREDSVKDIGALLDWIATQPQLDAKRVAVVGGSYGGYMVLASLMHFSDRLAAAVDVVGISNFVTFLENTQGYRRDLRRAEYGDERDPEMRAFLTRISPTENVARIQRPLFVAQGANDPRVPVTEAEQIVAAVRGQGKDVWYMLARNEGHGFARKENRDVFTQLMLMFLERHLAGERTPAE